MTRVMAGNAETKLHCCRQCVNNSRSSTCSLLLIVCLCSVAVTLVMYSNVTSGMKFVTDYTKIDARDPANVQPDRERLNSTLNRLLDIQNQYIRNTAIYMNKAHLHARGVKSNDALKHAIENFNNFLHTVNLSFSALTDRQVVQSQHICPEKITNSMTGFPMFEIGYIVQNCSHAVPLQKIVSILMLCDPSSIEVLEQTLIGVFSYLPKVSIIVGLRKQLVDKIQFAKYPTVTIVENKDTASKGKMWNDMASKVNTEYALIARDVISFNSDARIDRMVREIEMLKVTVVGGSTRHVDNKWKTSCQQRAFRNYTVSFIEGYDESIHDCLFCDHVDGPFLIRQTDLKKTLFDETMPEMGLFEDFFMRLKGEIVVCPDAMYYTNTKERSRETSPWKVFGKKRSLYELKLPGTTINFGCEDSTYPCGKSSGKMLSPCCMLELSKLNTYIDAVCTEGNVICQVHAGTLLGSLKFSNVLPWERDGDIQLYAANFTAAGKLRNKFTQKGYTFRNGRIGYPCTENKLPGYYEISSRNWRIEWWCFCQMQPLKQREKGLNNTLIPMGSKYVVGPRNPVLFARNRYPYFFKHAEHYSVIGQRSNDMYKKHLWYKCDSPGAHDCLDNYRVDGNIQFMDIIP